MRGEFVTVGDASVPPIGIGTYQTGGYECFNMVQAALDAGYRHIDTAMAYENEAVVGRAIETSPVDRDEVFLTTKIKGYPEFLEPYRLVDAFEGSLERLGVEYVDLLLIHWWNSDSDMEATFRAMNRLVEEGVVSHIGVSNFSVDQLDRAMAVSENPILTNQLEYHPYFDREEMLKFCHDNDVLLTAYSPLAVGRVARDETLIDIGKRYGKSPAQVALRWLIQQPKVVVIPKAVQPSHLNENIDIFDFTLSDGEMQTIRSLEGPLSYRLNAEGGLIYNFRNRAGSYVPKDVRHRLPF